MNAFDFILNSNFKLLVMDVFLSSNSPFSIVYHRLMGGGVIHLECPKNRRGLGEPDMIILHYTAGMDAMSSAKFLVRPDVKASALLVFKSVLMRVKLISLRSRGENGNTSVGLPKNWEQANVKVYCFATSKNGKSISPSLYLAVE